jgi:hypothetical protein
MYSRKDLQARRNKLLAEEQKGHKKTPKAVKND